MFDFRKYIKDAFLEAVGKQADYWIKLTSAEWAKSGVLLEEDLAEIQAAIAAQYVDEEPIEDATVLNDEEESTDVN